MCPNQTHLDVIFFCILFQIVFLHCDRYVEFHSQGGHYYKTRIPKFGRDFSYHYPSCDLYFVGARWEYDIMLDVQLNLVLMCFVILLLEQQIDNICFHS